jgi:hypothetical protein
MGVKLDVKPDTEARLLKGARLLGNLFRRGQMTPCGWNLCGSGIVCDADRELLHGEEWCRARRLFVRLALESGRTLIAGKYGLAESFTAQEFEASGVTLLVEIPELLEVQPELGPIRVGGPKGEVSLRSIPSLGGIEGLKSVVMVLRAFPGSAVA